MIVDKKYTTLLVFFLSFIFFVAIQLASINPGEQDRFFYFSIAMFKRGWSFFPYVNNQAYPDYIAFVMIMSDVSAKLFGGVTVLAVGLPYCIASAMLVTFTYKLGALENHKLGLLAAFFSLLCWKFLDGVSALDLDLFPALATLLCVYLLRQHAMKEKKLPLFSLNILWLFGYFCRGPIGLLVPAMISCLYAFSEKQWKKATLLGLNAIILFILGFIFLLLMAYQTEGLPFMYEVLEQQGFGRMVNEHNGRYYFFFTIGIIDYALTSIFALIVGSQYLSSLFKFNSKKSLLIFCMQWTVMIILFFTLPATKKARYIMPIVPAISLICAYAWVNEDLKKIKSIIRNMLVFFPTFCFVVAIVFFFLGKESAPLVLFVVCALILSAQWYLKKFQSDVLLFIYVFVAFTTLHLTILEPITLHSLSRVMMVPYF